MIPNRVYKGVQTVNSSSLGSRAAESSYGSTNGPIRYFLMKYMSIFPSLTQRMNVTPVMCAYPCHPPYRWIHMIHLSFLCPSTAGPAWHTAKSNPQQSQAQSHSRVESIRIHQKQVPLFFVGLFLFKNHNVLRARSAMAVEPS